MEDHHLLLELNSNIIFIVKLEMKDYTICNGFNITLFRSIIVLCGTNNILWNISSFRLNMRNVP